AHLRRRVDVRDEADRRHTRLDARRRNRRHDVPVLVDRGVGQPDRAQLLDEIPQQHELGRGTRTRGRSFVGLRVVSDVTEKTVEDVHKYVRCSRRTASSRRSRGTVQVMRNDEVATPGGAMPAATSAAEPRRTLSNDALMPAPTTLTAPRSS